MPRRSLKLLEGVNGHQRNSPSTSRFSTAESRPKDEEANPVVSVLLGGADLVGDRLSECRTFVFGARLRANMRGAKRV